MNESVRNKFPSRAEIMMMVRYTGMSENYMAGFFHCMRCVVAAYNGRMHRHLQNGRMRGGSAPAEYSGSKSSGGNENLRDGRNAGDDRDSRGRARASPCTGKLLRNIDCTEMIKKLYSSNK